MAPVTRAYSLITVKAVSEDQRTFTGIATTPSPDRMGDIIEPLGVTFKNPLPLLLYHDSHAPVGTVKFEKPTKDGIAFTAQIPTITEPGRLKDRVDEAWQSVKARLVRGVSIGFRVLNDAVDWMKDSGGFRYRETEVLELSLVAVPANQDATILALKSFDVGRPAATGTAAGVPSIRSGATDTRQMSRSMNTSERIAAKKADLRTKTEALDALMTKGDSEVLSDADRQAQTTLNRELEALTADIDSLASLEKAQAMNAQRVVAPGTPAAAEKQRVVEVKSTLPPGIEFARYVICKMAQLVSGGSVTALEVAKSRYPDYPRIQHLIKAAVTSHTSADGSNTGGTELVYAQNLVSEFIEFLRPMTIIGKFGANGIPSLRRIPFNVRITGQTTGGAGYWVGQGKQKPVKKFDFSATTLTFAKVAAISVLSDELARFSSPSAEAEIRQALSDALIERLDTDFVDPMKTLSANVSPASITNGVSPLTPSGTDAAAVRADIAQLLATFIAANINPVNGVFITTNTVALTLSLMRNALGQKEFPDVSMLGGRLEGFPLIASQYCSSGSPTSDLLIFANASDIFLADDGQVTIDASREASIEMESDPENQVGTVLSMYQSNNIALRAERYINWALRRAAAVAYLDGVAYASGSPTP